MRTRLVEDADLHGVVVGNRDGAVGQAGVPSTRVNHCSSLSSLSPM